MVKSARQTSGNGPAAGAVYRIEQWVGPGKTREMDMSLTVYDRPNHLEWLMANRHMDYRCVMRFEESKLGTRIVQDTRNVFKRSKMPRWISSMLARRQLNKQFAKLRKIFDGYDFTKPHTTTRW